MVGADDVRSSWSIGSASAEVLGPSWSGELDVDADSAPPADLLFEPAADRYGPRLSLVFGNEASEGVCPFLRAMQCLHCDIGRGEGRRFAEADNRRRLGWYLTHYTDVLRHIAHLIIYNSGSVLNPVEFSPLLLRQMMRVLAGLPQLRVISLDSRETFVTAAAVGPLVGELARSVTLRPIVGIETSNDRIRMQILRKTGTRAAIVRAFREIGKVGAKMGRDRVGVDVNVLLGGPGTSPELVVEDALSTCLFAVACAEEAGTTVDFNMNPYYPSMRGRKAFSQHGRCNVGVMARAVATITEVLRSRGLSPLVFVGWNDEGHDQEPDVRRAEWIRVRPVLDLFNVGQDPAVLSALEG